MQEADLWKYWKLESCVRCKLQARLGGGMLEQYQQWQLISPEP